jgi:hypothetical protein
MNNPIEALTSPTNNVKAIKHSRTSKPNAARQNQAVIQLSNLGYKDGDAVYLRFFNCKNHPEGKDGSGVNVQATFPNLPWGTIEIHQAQGKGCYFVVNGGGNSDKDVTQCKSLFYEHDDIPVEVQIDYWKGLGLPEPTMQISTGGKSIHNYWTFNETIEPSTWKALQSDIIKFAKSDPLLKNPSRVMRLAGADHVSYVDGNFVRVQSTVFEVDPKG